MTPMSHWISLDHRWSHGVFFPMKSSSEIAPTGNEHLEIIVPVDGILFA